jgi:hypothetical protein
MSQLPWSLVAFSAVLAAGASGCRKEPPAGRAATVQQGGIGIPACDEFLLEYEQCILRAPLRQREVLRERIGTLRQAWKAAAQQVQARRDLPRTCQAARSIARKALAGLKCRW